MTYKIRNWEHYQHYKDRNPPWIKLHYELLSSKDWVMLSDESRVLAIACMLIASRHEGEIPDEPEYIQRVAYLNKKPNFNALIDIGFLHPLNNPPKEKETYKKETETETEEQTNDSKCLQVLAKERKPAIDFDGKHFTNISSQEIHYWEEQYPAVDIDVELRKMEGWLYANPKNKKSNYKRFINTWLSKSQDGAKRVASPRDGQWLPENLR